MLNLSSVQLSRLMLHHPVSHDFLPLLLLSRMRLLLLDVMAALGSVKVVCGLTSYCLVMITVAMDPHLLSAHQQESALLVGEAPVQWAMRT